MALLTRNRLASVKHFVLYVRHVILLFAVIGSIIYLSVVARQDIAEPTVISDKSLLPGLVDESWRNRGDLDANLRKLEEFFIREAPDGNQRGDYIYNELQLKNFKVYKQNFYSNITKKRGINIYGILYSTREAIDESIIVVVKLHPEQKYAISVALSVALQSELKDYWSRSLIFLFVDGEDPNVGALAWLHALNGYYTSAYMWADQLEVTPSRIIGGLVLDLSLPRFTHFHLKYFGINGVLPNLDVFNVFVRLCEKHDVKTYILDDCNQALNIKNLWRGVFHQALNEVEDVHSILNHFGIHSIMLKADHCKRAKRVHGIDTAALILESGLRSFNNLLEKFHRSYFFYYLVSPSRFISIIYYFPAIGFYVVVMLVHQYNAWVDLSQHSMQCGAWARANLVAALMYISHIGIYTWYLGDDNFVSAWFNHQSDVDISIVVLTFNFVWPWLSAPRINSAAEHASVRYIQYGVLSIMLTSVGLVNPSIAIYLGIYFMISTLFCTLIPRNNIFTTHLYNLFMNPVTFYVYIMIFGEALGLWPNGFGELIRQRPTFGHISVVLLEEGRRMLKSHLQFNSFNFFIYSFLMQQAHIMFISMIGWEHVIVSMFLLFQHCLMSSFRSTVWDPSLIVGQIACNQCIFYSAECILMFAWSVWSDYRLNLDHVFMPITARPVSTIQLASAAMLGFAFSHVIQRAKNCLDFSCTVHFWHLILVIFYNAQLPTQLTWWLLQLISLTICTVVGEFFCMRKESAEIFLTTGGQSPRNSAI